MHELAMAQGIVDAVNLEADKKKAVVVKEINVDVGELMQLDADALRGALELLLKGPRLARAKLYLRIRKASFSCAKCGDKWDIGETMKQLSNLPDSLFVREQGGKEVPLHFLPYLLSSFVHCPKCKSSDVTTVEGEELELRRLVME